MTFTMWVLFLQDVAIGVLVWRLVKAGRVIRAQQTALSDYIKARNRGAAQRRQVLDRLAEEPDEADWPRFARNVLSRPPSDPTS